MSGVTSSSCKLMLESFQIGFAHTYSYVVLLLPSTALQRDVKFFLFRVEYVFAILIRDNEHGKQTCILQRKARFTLQVTADVSERRKTHGASTRRHRSAFTEM